jgi:hypothetical protein
MAKRILILVLILKLTLVKGQNLVFYGWYPTWSQTGVIHDKWRYNFFCTTTIDAFDRTINGVNYPAQNLQIYIQPSIAYHFNNSWAISFSYTYQRNNPFEPIIFTNEHRIWEQVAHRMNLHHVIVSNRLRFEERFIENKADGSYPLSTRLRHQIGFMIPLNGHTIDPKELYIHATNESYFSLTGIKNATYSEDWAYAGVGYQTTSLGRFELGIMTQTQVRNINEDLRVLLLLQIGWHTNFEFKHKKSL